MDHCNIQTEPGDQNVILPKREGFDHQENNQYFSTHIYVDHINERLKVKDFQTKDYRALTEYLESVCQKNNLTKIILVAGESNWQQLFTTGFLLEAINPSFFKGKPGFHLSKFLAQERKNSILWDREEEVLHKARQVAPTFKSLPEDYEIRTADVKDIPQLAELFSAVFETYPTPVGQEDYLIKAINNNNIFKAIFHENKIVSAASLDIDPSSLSAELTDCATLPEYQGQSLMSHLVLHLEEEGKSRGLITLYTIARAISVGVNSIFARFDYNYYGRFIKNCHICGQFEDMNLWAKTL